MSDRLARDKTAVCDPSCEDKERILPEHRCRRCLNLHMSVQNRDAALIDTIELLEGERNLREQVPNERCEDHEEEQSSYHQQAALV